LFDDPEEAELQQQQRKNNIANQLEIDLDPNRRKSIVQLGEMGVIPNEFIDDILVGAMTQHRRKESRMQFVKSKLERNMPTVVAETLAENLIDFVHEEEQLFPATDDTPQQNQNSNGDGGGVNTEKNTKQ